MNKLTIFLLCIFTIGLLVAYKAAVNIVNRYEDLKKQNIRYEQIIYLQQRQNLEYKLQLDYLEKRYNVSFPR